MRNPPEKDRGTPELETCGWFCSVPGPSHPSAKSVSLVERDREDTENDRPTDRPTGPAESIEPAESADVCAHLYCRETEGLYRVRSQRGVRVLCADHIEGWLG